MNLLSMTENFYHTKEQAEYVAACLSDEDWVAKVRFTGFKYVVDVYEINTGEPVKLFA